MENVVFLINVDDFFFLVPGSIHIVQIQHTYWSVRLSILGERRVVATLPVKYGDESLDTKGEGVRFFLPYQKFGLILAYRTKLFCFLNWDHCFKFYD